MAATAPVLGTTFGSGLAAEGAEVGDILLEPRCAVQPAKHPLCSLPVVAASPQHAELSPAGKDIFQSLFFYPLCFL